MGVDVSLEDIKRLTPRFTVRCSLFFDYTSYFQTMDQSILSTTALESEIHVANLAKEFKVKRHF